MAPYCRSFPNLLFWYDVRDCFFRPSGLPRAERRGKKKGGNGGEGGWGRSSEKTSTIPWLRRNKLDDGDALRSRARLMDKAGVL